MPSRRQTRNGRSCNVRHGYVIGVCNWIDARMEEPRGARGRRGCRRRAAISLESRIRNPTRVTLTCCTTAALRADQENVVDVDAAEEVDFKELSQEKVGIDVAGAPKLSCDSSDRSLG